METGEDRSPRARASWNCREWPRDNEMMRQSDRRPWKSASWSACQPTDWPPFRYKLKLQESGHSLGGDATDGHGRREQLLDPRRKIARRDADPPVSVGANARGADQPSGESGHRPVAAHGPGPDVALQGLAVCPIDEVKRQRVAQQACVGAAWTVLERILPFGAGGGGVSD